jgi:hypothetical protein
MKIRSMGVDCSMRTDGQRDMAMLKVTFHHYANALKTCYLFCYLLNETLVNCEWQNEWNMNWKQNIRKEADVWFNLK